MSKKPSLYGIKNTNRPDAALWGKNQFNSTFPVALACYMRDTKINPVYLRLNDDLKVVADTMTFDDVFKTKKPNESLRFDFETEYLPYRKYAYDNIGGIDLVVKDEDEYLRPLEVKLTVIPDNTTCNDSEDNWGPELVIRPASTSYCALGIAHRCLPEIDKLREIIEPVCSGVQRWDSTHEISTKRTILLDALDQFQREFNIRQEPFLMHPIWKTKGKSAELDENAFDIFIWSDFALCRTFLDKSRTDSDPDPVTRFMRSSARLARVLYELSTRNIANITQIYTEMAFGLQTDKEFALSGRVTREYMKSFRRVKPVLQDKVIRDIILNGGEKLLSPERRFDATIFFTADKLFEIEEALKSGK